MKQVSGKFVGRSKGLAGIGTVGETGLKDTGFSEMGLRDTGFSEMGLEDTGISEIGLEDTGFSF